MCYNTTIIFFGYSFPANYLFDYLVIIIMFLLVGGLLYTYLLSIILYEEFGKQIFHLFIKNIAFRVYMKSSACPMII